MPKTNEKILSVPDELGKLGTQLKKLRDARSKIARDAAKKDAPLKQEADEIESRLIELMELSKLAVAGTNALTIKLNKTPIANIKDWTSFERFVLRNKALHLFQRRVSNPAYVELMEHRKGKAIPGAETFDKKSIGLYAKK